MVVLTGTISRRGRAVRMMRPEFDDILVLL